MGIFGDQGMMRILLLQEIRPGVTGALEGTSRQRALHEIQTDFESKSF
jgi:hypothetical protein